MSSAETYAKEAIRLAEAEGICIAQAMLEYKESVGEYEDFYVPGDPAVSWASVLDAASVVRDEPPYGQNPAYIIVGYTFSDGSSIDLLNRSFVCSAEKADGENLFRGGGKFSPSRAARRERRLDRYVQEVYETVAAEGNVSIADVAMRFLIVLDEKFIEPGSLPYRVKGDLDIRFWRLLVRVSGTSGGFGLYPFYDGSAIQASDSGYAISALATRELKCADKLTWTLQEDGWLRSDLGGFYVQETQGLCYVWQICGGDLVTRYEELSTMSEALEWAQTAYNVYIRNAQVSGHLARRGVKTQRDVPVRVPRSDGSIASEPQEEWKEYGRLFLYNVSGIYFGKVESDGQRYVSKVRGSDRKMTWDTLSEAKAAVEWYAAAWLRKAAEAVVS